MESFFTASCYTVMHVNCRFISKYWNLKTDRANKAVWCPGIFKNVFVACKFSPRSFENCSKLCFVYIKVAADYNAEEAFRNVWTDRALFQMSR